MNHIEAIREFIIKKFLYGKGERLKEDTSLVDEGIIDSLGILELVSFLEETFEIQFDDEEIVAENLENLKSIVDLVKRKLCQLEKRHR